MTTVPRGLNVQSSILPGRGVFNMWHDYMNLSKVLERLGSNREVEIPDTGCPKMGQVALWSKVQTSIRRKKSSKYSSESSSASTVSDSSCSVTSADYCHFCKQNGEIPNVYRSHKLKSDDRKVFCPILQEYTCPLCEATGDNAHTCRYCPQVKQEETGRMLTGGSFWKTEAGSWKLRA